MDKRVLSFLYLIMVPFVLALWPDPATSPEQFQNMGSKYHYPNKRHMHPTTGQAMKSRTGGPVNLKRFTQLREAARKKPSGHLTPLDEDDIDNEEVMSVAIHPPALRKIERLFSKNRLNARKKPVYEPIPSSSSITVEEIKKHNSAENLVKNVVVNLAQDFMLKQVDENFIFGQYVGNSMRNLSNELRTKMQHDILDLIVIYQKLNLSEGEKFFSDAQNPMMAVNSTIKFDVKRDSGKEIHLSDTRYNVTNEEVVDYRNIVQDNK